MTGLKLMIPALAAIASATVSVGLTATANATPVGPCAEVPYIGVCVPPSEHPSPPQQSSGETANIPDSTGGTSFVN
jgi:hypothetical protein